MSHWVTGEADTGVSSQHLWGFFLSINPRVIFSLFFLFYQSSHQQLIVIITMRTVTGKHLLCFLLLAVTLSWAEKDVRTGKTENDTGED